MSLNPKKVVFWLPLRGNDIFSEMCLHHCAHNCGNELRTSRDWCWEQCCLEAWELEKVRWCISPLVSCFWIDIQTNEHMHTSPPLMGECQRWFHGSHRSRKFASNVPAWVSHSSRKRSPPLLRPTPSQRAATEPPIVDRTKLASCLCRYYCTRTFPNTMDGWICPCRLLEECSWMWWVGGIFSVSHWCDTGKYMQEYSYRWSTSPGEHSPTNKKHRKERNSRIRLCRLPQWSY